MRSAATALSLLALSPLGTLALPRGSTINTQASRPDRDLDGAVWKSLISKAARVKRQSSWDPPSELVKPLHEVWDHTVESYNNGQWDAFKNYGYDIIVAAEGKLNFCVRWDSSGSVTAEQRNAIEKSLQANVPKWTDHLTGFMGWPYQNVSANVVGWAVSDASKLQGSTDNIQVYDSTADAEGIPECDPRCGRFFHQDSDYSECPSGPEGRYDMSLWLTEGMEGGAGGDWGQRVGSEYFLGALDAPHIWLHEFGHTLALDDFYDWLPAGQDAFIMNAGSSTEVKEFDIWMMRDWWRNLASRYV
ncbi:hypothetical protein WHR41_04752 [Cladosporium halotolerans]|uniref:Uncharacterized protein n=1 Tax=Cladosporium halotolerans TaxID=1052096 RepID=A0AB34KMF8_9PEZI